MPAEENNNEYISFKAWKNKNIHFENAKIDLFFKDNDNGAKAIAILSTDKQNIGMILFKKDELAEFYIAGDNKLAISVKANLMEIIGLDYVVDIFINKDGVIAKESINSDLIFIPNK